LIGLLAFESDGTVLRSIDVVVYGVDVKTWGNGQDTGYSESTGQVILPMAFLTGIGKEKEPRNRK